MDAEKPRSENREDARKRAEALTTPPPESKKAESPAEEGTGRALTERQRIEARKRRQARRRRPFKGNPLQRGLKATGFEIRRTASFLGNAVLAALASLGPVFSKFGMAVVWLTEAAGKGLGVLRRLWIRLLVAIGGAIRAADRVVTPQRALLVVSAAAAILLAVSQFKGLGAIEIGQPGYAGIEDLARAPTIDHTTPAGVHTKIMVPVAIAALLAVVVIALGSLRAQARRFSRWRRLASMVLVTVGLLSLVVTLLIDLPRAMDTTDAELAYADVSAVLLSGFWLELASGAALAISGLALLFEPSADRVRRREREPRGQDRNASRVPKEARVTGSRA
ncbi:MAG TPA: hypothetical protein PKD76_12465 [Solirubrobacterales bacterium]|nr:hypothetical protein [Solirubrobacterales bacterium]